MEILEYGNKNKDKIILIHGFESPYQIWDDYIDYYKNNYHIIVPILEGHNPGRKDTFISFKESAKEIEDYYISRYGNKVYAIYGMSMGGVLTAQLWQNKKLDIQNIILDSSPLISYNKFVTKVLIKQYLMLTHKAKERNKKVINKAINTIISRDKLDEFLKVIDIISDTTIINYIKEVGKYKLPKDIETPNTKIYYFYGTKINEVLAKRTANYIGKYYSNSKIICFKGKGHCENSLMNSNVMIKELNKIL